jgi:hypothetical protein
MPILNNYTLDFSRVFAGRNSDIDTTRAAESQVILAKQIGPD